MSPQSNLVFSDIMDCMREKTEGIPLSQVMDGLMFADDVVLVTETPKKL